jgi:hypothetical protein
MFFPWHHPDRKVVRRLIQGRGRHLASHHGGKLDRGREDAELRRLACERTCARGFLLCL